MTFLIRANPQPLTRSMPFVISGWIHGFLLAYVALTPPRGPAPRSLYEQQIQPHETRLVWYKLHDRLPDISPGASKSKQPPRAREKSDQTIVAGAKDLPGPRQMISMPAPEIKTPDPLPLPNVIAVTPPPRPVKAFTAPAVKLVPPPPAQLPEAPLVKAAVEPKSLPFDTKVAKPAPRKFTPPPAARSKTAEPAALPDAPTVTAAVQGKKLPIDVPDPRAPRKAFTPPPSARSKTGEPAALPDAPTVTAAVQGKKLPIDVPDPRAPRKAFTPPPSARRADAGAPGAMPEAPTVATTVAGGSLPIDVPDPRAPVRAFTPPPASRGKAAPVPDLPVSPEVSRPESTPSDVSLAIVGMNPDKALDFPTPPGSRNAGFSAGPIPKPNGGNTTGESISPSMIVVPGLLVRGGTKDNQPTLMANASPTSRENLLAAARAALGNAPDPAKSPGQGSATRVSSAPDLRLNGRAVYTVAIQMPNVTSFSGSWIVWFAEREPQPGAPSHEVKGPVPLRKVDPKYIAAAADERVEGVVRLYAVIRKDGHVESVLLVRHLDERLDRTAQEALAQWVFQPAQVDGIPIDVEAVFEIPFHLAPKPAK